MPEDYCELCDLPLSTCVHGMPAPPAEAERAPRASPVRTSRVPGTSAEATAAAAARAPAARTSRPRAAAAAAPARPSRVTSVEAIRPHVVAVLHDAGGPLETAEVMAQLEERLQDTLQERDRQVSPTGEVRWQTAARKARKALIDEGLVMGAQPGLWQLTDAGAAQA